MFSARHTKFGCCVGWEEGRWYLDVATGSRREYRLDAGSGRKGGVTVIRGVYMENKVKAFNVSLEIETEYRLIWSEL